MTSSPLLVFTAVPEPTIAQTIAQQLVQQRLAACVTILPAAQSVYRWENKIENASELTLVIKTVAAHYPQLQATLTALHPYDLPEIIAVSVADGLPAYLNWIAHETQTDEPI